MQRMRERDRRVARPRQYMGAIGDGQSESPKTFTPRLSSKEGS
jgi:hypothetical protein